MPDADGRALEPHWYIQLQGGAQYTTGETKFSKLISPTVQGAVGYQFSKAIGARLAFNAWQGRGGYDEDLVVSKLLGADQDMNYKYTYFAPAICQLLSQVLTQTV